MKIYTNSEQTAKLIELGFEKPKFEIETQLCNIKGQPLRAATIVGDYSIGDLIEMLEYAVNESNNSGIITDLAITRDETTWLVVYMAEGVGRYKTEMFDLIDALYRMIIRLKEEGVI